MVMQIVAIKDFITIPKKNILLVKKNVSHTARRSVVYSTVKTSICQASLIDTDVGPTPALRKNIYTGYDSGAKLWCQPF
jgi:hypothetical protein